MHLKTDGISDLMKYNRLSFFHFKVAFLFRCVLYSLIYGTSPLLMDIWVTPIFHYDKHCCSKYSCAYIFHTCVIFSLGQ